jgi:TPP-dependent pyruvate/acetoin dehydrogenase alpha subunit
MAVQPGATMRSGVSDAFGRSDGRPDSSERDATITYSRTEAVALIRLRYWMHLLNEMLKQGQFLIPIHLGFGHEAVAVGMDFTMEPPDVLCLSHRNAAYNLARSKSFAQVLSHYRLEEQPGRLAQMASMNLAVDGTGIAYSSSILGNNMAVACGIAMNRKLLQRPGVVFVATGDGAIEEGTFWESLVFARSHGLGIAVVLENNDCSMSSSIAQRRYPVDLSLVCAGLGVTYRRADGAALGDVRRMLRAAREDAGAGNVTLVEFDLKTFNQHAGPTPGWPGDPMRIALDDGLTLGDSPRDPLNLLRQSLGEEEFRRLADETTRMDRVG